MRNSGRSWVQTRVTPFHTRWVVCVVGFATWSSLTFPGCRHVLLGGRRRPLESKFDAMDDERQDFSDLRALFINTTLTGRLGSATRSASST